MVPHSKSRSLNSPSQIIDLVSGVETPSHRGLRERLDGASNQGVREMEYSYFGQARQQGIQQGMHLLLLELLQERFGELPPVITDQVRAIESQDELTTLATKVLNAESLEDLGLNGTA